MFCQKHNVIYQPFWVLSANGQQLKSPAVTAAALEWTTLVVAEETAQETTEETAEETTEQTAEEMAMLVGSEC